MQKTVRTTITLDATEVKDIIAAHLRKKGDLGERQKYNFAVLIPGEHGSQDVHDIKNAADFYVRVEWPSAEAAQVVGKVGS